MAILGVFCFPGTGHINPMTALARQLRQRGHRVIFFGIADIGARVRATGAEFQQIGQQDYPPGTLRQLDQKLSQLKGLNTFRFTVERVNNHARMVLRDGPAAVQAAGVEALLIDEADMVGSVAEYLKLPYVSIACFPPLLQDDTMPPFCFGWPYGTGLASRLRNRLGAAVLRRVASPIFKSVNKQRQEWGLAPLQHPSAALSKLAQITQLPEALEFPYANRPSWLHYAGPFVDIQAREPVPFPWEQLDGRPLVYGSLGTLQNGSEHIFATIAKACAELNAQLVLSMGGSKDPAELGELPGQPIVVRYAPQLEILKRASAVITHAGLNTTLESLAEGVPLVAIPLGNDQPGVAARIEHHKAGIAIPLSKLNVQRLHTAVDSVFRQEVYRESAMRIRDAIRQIDALTTAADVVEHSLGLRRAVAAR